MSSSTSVTLQCPRCGYKTDLRVWESINIQINPEMKQKVKDGSLFRHTCPQCGVTSALNSSLLYHDMEKQLMVYYVNSQEEADEVARFFSGDISGTAEADELVRDTTNDYTLRIVPSSDLLREKIYIFDAGYDDRIIEFIKVFIITELLEKDPDFESELMFYHAPDGTDCFQFIGGKEDGNGLELPPGMYEKVEEAFAPRLTGLSGEDEYVINQAWALDFLNNSQGK